MSLRSRVVFSVILTIIICAGTSLAGVEIEPNNNRASATQIPDGLASASIDDEYDWFRVQLPTTGSVTVRLSGVPSELQTQLGVEGFPHTGWQDGQGDIQYSFNATSGEGLVWVNFKYVSSVCGSDWCAVQFTSGGPWHAIKPSASMPATYEGLPIVTEVSTYQLIIEVEAIPSTIVRGPENDTINIDLGNYTVYGGGGTDTLVVPLFPNEYQLSQNGGNQYTASYRGYTSMIDSVEYFEFGNTWQTQVSVADLLSGKVQDQVAKLTDLYLAFFGRAPDVEGLEYWQMKHLAEGRDTTTISKDFSWSGEAQALFPLGASNRDFVKTVYQNCFGREPDQGGWDYWTAKLDALDPNDPDYLNDRGAFVGEVLLGAYAETSGAEDRNLLINRHAVALEYVNRLSMQPAEGFDAAINGLLGMVSMDPASRYNAENVIDHVFNDGATLTGVMANTALLSTLWIHDASYDVDNDGDGSSEIQGDCNDALTTVYLGAPEVCGDGIDQDCNGVDQSCPQVLDGDGDGWTEAEGDCNDAVASIYPGAAEVCGDGIDQNCNGSDLACNGGGCDDSPSLADLAGYWDISEDYGAWGYDQIYLYINADGSYTTYDYAGDSFDDEANCYWVDSSSLTALGNGTFRDNDDGSTATISLCGDYMTLNADGMSGTYPRTGQGNYTPVCP